MPCLRPMSRSFLSALVLLPIPFVFLAAQERTPLDIPPPDSAPSAPREAPRRVHRHPHPALPMGWYVDTVTLGGRYVALDDGTLWEVRLDDRARAAGWTSEDFVVISRIAAPTGDYEWRFVPRGFPGGEVAVRLAGRRK